MSITTLHVLYVCKLAMQMRCRTVLAPKDVSLLERCPHFRVCYVQSSMELGPEDVEKCPHFRGCYVHNIMYSLQWSWDLKMCPYLRGVLISEGVTVCTVFNGVYRHT